VKEPTAANEDVWAVVDEQIAEDRTLFKAAGITEPVECPRCGRSIETFRDQSDALRFQPHQARERVQCGRSGAYV
jgi:ribosomal protein S27AE